MVLFTVTPALAAAIETCKKDPSSPTHQSDPAEPELADVTLGSPISHGQILDISRYLKARNHDDISSDLDSLMRGAQVYVAPPKPKAQKTPEYKALMARLRREEESRQYSRMTTNQDDAGDIMPGEVEDDDVTYAEVHRQMIMIINVLVSIVACGVAIWIVARRWSAPARLGLSMCGSGAVGVAEVVIYAGYIRRLKHAKEKEKKKKEKKEVVATWVLEGGDRAEKSVSLQSTKATGAEEAAGLRKRRLKA